MAYNPRCPHCRWPVAYWTTVIALAVHTGLMMVFGAMPVTIVLLAAMLLIVVYANSRTLVR